MIVPAVGTITAPAHRWVNGIARVSIFSLKYRQAKILFRLQSVSLLKCVEHWKEKSIIKLRRHALAKGGQRAKEETMQS
jgi:hypothetical protein